jgi:hypothetical protein
MGEESVVRTRDPRCTDSEERRLVYAQSMNVNPSILSNDFPAVINVIVEQREERRDANFACQTMIT